MSKKQDVMSVLQVLIPYKFAEIHCEKTHSRKKYDLVITNKKSHIHKNTPTMFIGIEDKQTNEHFIECKAINRNALNFMLDIQEKESVFIEKKENKTYKFTENIFKRGEKFFPNKQNAIEYFSKFQNENLIKIINYIFETGIENFICKKYKNYLTFILEKDVDKFFKNNYFEKAFTKNKKYHLCFAL